MTHTELSPPRRLQGVSAKQPAMRIAVAEPPRSFADGNSLRHVRTNEGCTCVARIMRFLLWGMRNNMR